MIYSPYAIDYSKGVTIRPNGTLKANKIGCFVLTLQECNFILECRRLRGEFENCEKCIYWRTK
jgi:hypothetical protein